MKYLVLVFVAAQLAFVCGESDLFLREPCQKSDEEVSECLHRAFENFKSRLHDGVPEYRIPSIDPLRVSVIRINRKLGDTVAINALMKNLSAAHSTQFSVDKLHFNPDTLELETTVTHPELFITTGSKFAGKIGDFILEHQGVLLLNLNDVTTDVSLKFREKKSKKFNYFTIDRFNIKLKIGKLKVQIFSSKPESQFLVDFVANTFNENSQRLLELINPIIVEAVEQILHGELNKIFKRIPVNRIIVD